MRIPYFCSFCNLCYYICNRLLGIITDLTPIDLTYYCQKRLHVRRKVGKSRGNAQERRVYPPDILPIAIAQEGRRCYHALWLPIKNSMHALWKHLARKGNSYGFKSGSGKGDTRANRHSTIGNIDSFVERQAAPTSSTLLRCSMQAICQHIRQGSRTGKLESCLDTTTRMGYP